jgi:ribonuclease BN (tRNA processing enzyme)
VLGCDGSWPGPDGAGSGYVVEAGTTAVLLDAGPGTFARLQGWGDPSRIDAVILSHEHPDHWTDLESFATWLSYGPGRSMAGDPDRALPVYAPPGVRRWSHYGAAAWLDWRELAPSMVLTIGEIEARFVASDHGPPTLAVSFSNGQATLAYSADTGPGWSVQELGDSIDVFLCEATYTEEFEGSGRHLSGRQAGEMAKKAGVGRLVLTHRWPTVSAEAVGQEAAQAFGAPVEQATAGARFDW